MNAPESLIPRRINVGSMVTAYALTELKQRIHEDRLVLPVCSLGTSADQLASLGPWVLPPLYHEALTGDLKDQLIARIRTCCPYFEGTRARAAWRGRLDVVELPASRPPSPRRPPRVLAFSVDTGVEQHGPHLPLATDTIQSYAVLERLAPEIDGFVVGPPLDYGQLTWGLPFGFSIDVTAPVITRYVTGFVNAMLDWLAPESIYVVDVHGSLVHRNAIHAGLQASRCARHAFRWLHDPLTMFSAERGDMHAGGVETILIETISPQLIDARWWPGRASELTAGQLDVKTAVALSGDLRKLIDYVEGRPCNGIIGDLPNYFTLDGKAMLARMVETARADVRALLERTR